jgi:subtilisin family serine protease
LIKKLSSIIFSILFIASCGGGGGGSGNNNGQPEPQPDLPPTVNLTADPTSVLLNNTSTLSWASTNATSCSASWTTKTSFSGEEAVTITAAGNNSFSITCSGSGGSRSASVTVEGYREVGGVVVDGYISGAEVFIDEDDDWVLDSNENSTTSDNEGKFTIRYANGNLVSIGGTDLDSQTLLDDLLITHKLIGHSDFKAVTPVTSVAAFMEDASLVNAALGIDSSIDVFTFDPVANKGDGNINDYLYEKGNQLTVLALALQNISNDLNTTTETTQDYFKAISEEVEKEYTETKTRVDIETQAFASKALDNVIAAKSLTIGDTAKANTIKTLSGILPIIQVKSDDTLTTEIIKFGISTLQTDIIGIANGSADENTVNGYTNDVFNYIANSQNLNADDLVPDIGAIDDSITTDEDNSVQFNALLNDSFVTSSTYSVTHTQPLNGSISLSGDVFNYSPNKDFNGSDAFTYTITQSEKTDTANINIAINPVNDPPSIEIASTIQVAENQTDVTTVSVSDVDGDELTLTLGGTDADSFNLSNENKLSFKELPDYENKISYSIRLILTDGIVTVDKDLIINVLDVDEAPVFTSSDIFNADENQTAIDTVLASDPEGSSITFELSGIDANSMSISSSGVLTFNSAPNYELKNTYSIDVIIGDSVNTTTQNITININDINDVPIVTSASYNLNLLPQDQTSKAITLSATDEDGDTLTYSIINNGTYGTASFSAQSATETINVSVAVNNSGSGNVYVIDGTQRKALSLNVGTTYTFIHSDSHPFRFSSTSNGTHGGGTEYTTGVTKSAGSTIIEVTSLTPTTLYYYCSIHPGMGASATMVNSNVDSSVRYKTSSSTQSAQAESFTYKVNDGTADSNTATVTIDLKTDPLYQYQWHLNNTAQTNFASNSGTVGEDLNIDNVIIDGITGSGIKISIVDDGLEIAHEDLIDNIVDGSWNFINSSSDPTQSSSDTDGGHGTSIGGIIAAKGWNNIGVRGIAPNASIFGYNFLQTGFSSEHDQSLGVNPPGGVTADIYNMSYGAAYGTDDEGNLLPEYDLPSYLSESQEQKFINGTSNLRDGKGAIYLWAAGNEFNDSSVTDFCGNGESFTCTETSIDNFNAMPYIVTVGALDANGLKTTYSTPGAGMWVSGFGGEYGYNSDIYSSGVDWEDGDLDPAIMTVDRSGCVNGYSSGVDGDSYSGSNTFDIGGYGFEDNETLNPTCSYISTFNGTSAATPTIAGVVALILEANPNLTWRDIKHILVTTSDKIDANRTASLSGISQYGWITNAAGYEHHNWYGFGKINASAAVNAAKSYTANSLGVFTDTGYLQVLPESSIEDGEATTATIDITKPTDSNGVVEFVRVSLSFNHPAAWSVGVRLQSPSGTLVNLMQPNTNITNPGNTLFEIGASAFYGESMEGTWTIELIDYYTGNTGTLNAFGIQIYGN